MRLLFSGNHGISRHGLLYVTPYLIASEKIVESNPNSRLMVEGLRVLLFSMTRSVAGRDSDFNLRQHRAHSAGDEWQQQCLHALCLWAELCTELFDCQHRSR